jgi:hypothetical protein
MRRRALGLTFVFVMVGALLAGIVAGEGRAVAAGSGSARVTLLSKGASPRSPLRLAITAGAATSASMEFSQSIEQSVDGTPTNAVDLPPTQILVHVTAGSVSADGDAQISSSYSDIKVVDDGSLEPAELERLESAYAPLESVTGTGRLTARNQVFDSTLAGTEGFDPAVATAMSQVSDQVASISVPFPAEAVGIGARWRGVSSARIGGINVRQSYEYTLRKRDPNRVGLDVEFTQTAPRQGADLAGVPKGTKVQITKFRISGTGTTTVALAALMPVASRMHASGVQVFSVRTQGKRSSLAQKMTADVTVSRLPGEGQE